MENKYKVGDKVQVVGNKASHQFKIGDIVVITYHDDIDEYKCTGEDGDIWWLYKEDIQEIKTTEQVNKEDSITQENTSIPEVLPATILDTAKGLVYGDRAKEYGSATKNFADIAKGWEVLFGCSITPEQVALAMGWLKIVRANKDNGNHRDSLVDCCGYMACVEKIKNGL